MRTTKFDTAITALYGLANQTEQKVLVLKDLRRLFGDSVANRAMPPGVQEELELQAREFRQAAQALRGD